MTAIFAVPLLLSLASLIGLVAALTGETLTDAIRVSLAERLERERLRQGRSTRLADRLEELAQACAALPDLDPRSPDEIIGYDETGMWR